MKKKFNLITMCENKVVDINLVIKLKDKLVKEFKLKAVVENGEKFILKYKNSEILVTYKKNGKELFKGTEAEYVTSEYMRKECVGILSSVLRTIGIVSFDAKLYYGLKENRSTNQEEKDIMLEEKMFKMFDMQDKLNRMQAGENWKKGFSSEGKEINWSKYLYMEMFELLESIPYKHWKDIKAKIDMDNIKIEIIDGWHFFMSAALESMYKNEAKIDDGINSISKFIKEYNFERANRINSLVELTEDLISHSIYAAKETRLNGFASVKSVGLMLEDIIEIVNDVFENGFDDVYELYMGKNILNLFRNDNGYKNGSYVKMWDYNGKKVEDNVVMQDLIKKVGVENLREALKKEYSKKENPNKRTVDDVKQQILEKVRKETGKKVNMSHINKRIKSLNLSGKVSENFDTIVESFK